MFVGVEESSRPPWGVKILFEDKERNEFLWSGTGEKNLDTPSSFVSRDNVLFDLNLSENTLAGRERALASARLH